MGGCTSSPEKGKDPKPVLKKSSFKYQHVNDNIFKCKDESSRVPLDGILSSALAEEIKEPAGNGLCQVRNPIDLDDERHEEDEEKKKQPMAAVEAVVLPAAFSPVTEALPVVTTTTCQELASRVLTDPDAYPDPSQAHRVVVNGVQDSAKAVVSPSDVTWETTTGVPNGDLEKDSDAESAVVEIAVTKFREVADPVVERFEHVEHAITDVTGLADSAVERAEHVEHAITDVTGLADSAVERAEHVEHAVTDVPGLAESTVERVVTDVTKPVVEIVVTEATDEAAPTQEVAMETEHSDSEVADCQSPQVENILKPLELKDDDYLKVMDLMHEDLVKGMTPETHATSNIKCFPTYVRSVPDGSETGDFLALDLGGTNFRVLLINLNKQEVKMESKIYIIPQHIMLGTGVQLFDHIADCIFKFMSDQNLLNVQLPLGFTFSFPCRQVGLDKAILTTWTKGFRCEGVEGNDIVQLLHEAIDRRNDMTNVRCLAVINDTVGALMSCAHSDRQCAIGLILGTGTNACYIEDLSEVKTWDGDDQEPKQVLINSEWGAFGNDGNMDFVLTDFDRSIDKHSINPGKQIYEKMISGMYMGEIARLAIERLRKHNLLFEGEGSYHLSTRGRFYTKYVSEIEGDDVDSFTVTKQIFEELELTTYTEQDCRLVRHVCSLVSRRAAFLASAGIACLLNKMNRLEVTVGVDGSLYRFHPFFHELMMEKIRVLTRPNIQFKLMLSHDGSGKGAALVAAVAHRLLQEKAEDTNADNGNVGEAVH